MRLDQYLVVHQLLDSRNKAAAAIRAGLVTVDGQVVTKPSASVKEDTQVHLSQQRVYVARSAYKLLHGLTRFSIDWRGRTAADFGASTGGFCQVLLEHGLRRIYAVDIGTAQLHEKVKNDPRIVNLEHTNARYLNASRFTEPIDVVTADLSFISVQTVLPAIYHTLTPEGEALVLIKPQFEAGSQFLNKNGVVTDRKVHRRVLEKSAQAAQNLDFAVKGISFCGLSGEAGNREYLLYLTKRREASVSITPAAEQAVLTEENDE